MPPFDEWDSAQVGCSHSELMEERFWIGSVLYQTSEGVWKWTGTALKAIGSRSRVR